MAQEIYHRSEWGNPNEQWGNVYLNADLTNELYKRASEYENSWVTDQLLNGVGTKPSIILTPTAYEDGVLNSVKPAKTFGSELIPNGTFKENVNGWITNNDNASFVWQIDQTALFTSTSFAYAKLNPTLNLTSGTYKVSFDILSFTGTLSNVHIGLGTSGNTVTTTGSFSYNYVSSGGSTEFQIRPNSGGTGSIKIDNISVKKITDADFDFTRGSSATRVNEKGLVQDVQLLSGELVQNGDFSQIGSELITNGDFATDSDWTLGTGWSIGDGVAVATNAADGERLRQDDVFIAGKIYKVTYEITEISQGGFRGYVGGTNLTIRSAVGVYTETLVAPSIDVFYIKTIGTTTGSIDNVSVKEVGQNWTFGTDWSMGDGKAVRTGTTSSGLTQSGSFNSGKKYKLEFTISDYVGGSIKGEFSGGGGSDVFFTSNNIGNGTFTFITETTTNRTNLQFYAFNSFSGSIDNISLIEITDDTDLPRINYTNFDYQDVLGDELVTNGTFDTDSDWSIGTGWSISDGYLNGSSASTSTQVTQSFSPTAGRTYQITLDVQLTSGELQIGFSTGTSIYSSNMTTSGTYTFVLVANVGNNLIKIRAKNSAFTGKVDNVSVKELTEDVVVPYSGEGSLLLEPQSTNLITYSEDFSQSVWEKVGVTTEDSSIVSPDGTQNATKLVRPNNTSSAWIRQRPTVVVGQNQVISVFAKTGNEAVFCITYYDVIDNDRFFNFDLSTQVISGNGLTNDTYVDSGIEDYGNGWFRCYAVIEAGFEVPQIQFGVGVNRVGLPNEYLYIYAPQFESNASYPTSYIPTSGSAVTRLADACNNAGSSDLINSTEGVLYAEISALANDGTYRLMSISDGTSTNRITLGYSNGSNLLLVQVHSSGVSQVNFTYSISDITLYNKIALLYKSNEVTIWVNGVKGTSDTSASMPIGLSEFNFNYTDALPLYGNVKCVAVFKEALSDTELQKLTTI